MRDALIRHAAFDWLATQVVLHGDVLPRDILPQGLIYQGQRVPLLGPKGIFKPAALDDAPLSITTAPNSPYDDAFGTDQLLSYRYRGTDPHHPDNVGLRLAMRRRIPRCISMEWCPGSMWLHGRCISSVTTRGS